MSYIMSYINTDTACCGLGEVDNINGEKPEEILRNIKNNFKKFYPDDEWGYGEFNGTFLIFSDIRKKKYGKDLAKYIVKNNLGEVGTLPSNKNPNSGNSLKVWLWRINFITLAEWYKNN